MGCCPRGQRQAAAMALRAACNEIEIQDIHTPSALSGLNSVFFRSSSSSCTPKMATPGIIPTLVSRRKSSTAGVARASRKRRRSDRALGPLHSQSLSTLCQSALVSGVHLLHRMKRWCLVCLSPEPHHQHLSLGARPIRCRWGGVAACPDRSG